RSPRQGARHQPQPRHPGAGRALERGAADHDGAGLGGAVRVVEIRLLPEAAVSGLGRRRTRSRPNGSVDLVATAAYDPLMPQARSKSEASFYIEPRSGDRYPLDI